MDTTTLRYAEELVGIKWVLNLAVTLTATRRLP
jgi:hypothetical protein